MAFDRDPNVWIAIEPLSLGVERGAVAVVEIILVGIEEDPVALEADRPDEILAGARTHSGRVIR